jgi:hypothetical protein
MVSALLMVSGFLIKQILNYWFFTSGMVAYLETTLGGMLFVRLFEMQFFTGVQHKFINCIFFFKMMC